MRKHLPNHHEVKHFDQDSNWMNRLNIVGIGNHIRKDEPGLENESAFLISDTGEGWLMHGEEQ